MSHHGQALRQMSVDENRETVVRRKHTEDDHEDGCFYLYEYVSKTKYKMLLYNFKLILISSTL